MKKYEIVRAGFSPRADMFVATRFSEESVHWFFAAIPIKFALSRSDRRWNQVHR